MSDLEGPAPGTAARVGDADATVAHNAFYLVVGQITTTALAIGLSAALGRHLGARDFGLYYLVTTMSTFAYVFVEWGQPYVVIREVAREPRRSGELLGTALVLRAAFALVVTAPAALSAWALGYGGRTTSFLVLFILAALPLFLAQGYGMVFRAENRMGRDATVSVLNKVVALCVALPALALGAGIPGVIFAQAIAGVAALGVAINLHGQPRTPPLRVSSATGAELLSAGTPILAMTAAIWAQPYLDVVILSRLVPAAVVGWFGAARNLVGTLTAPAVILATATYPPLARASADAAALRREVRAAFRRVLWLAALAGTGTYLFADTAIALIYGHRGFEPSAAILQVFAPGFLLLFVDILLANVIYASGRGSGFAAAKVMSVVVGTALDILLIPFFQDHFGNGGIGVFVAFALSELVVFAGAMVILGRDTLEPVTALDAARALAAASATLLLFRLIRPSSPWIGVPLFLATFVGASLALGLVGRSDLAVLRTLFRRQRIDAVAARESHD
jgi:O-antigen/teichoic acid export membrane protein